MRASTSWGEESWGLPPLRKRGAHGAAVKAESLGCPLNIPCTSLPKDTCTQSLILSDSPPIHPHHEPGLGLGPCISHLPIVTPFWLTRSLGCKPMMFLQSTSDHIDSQKTPPRLPSPLSTVFEGLWSSCWQPLCPVPHDTERVHSTSPQNMTSGIGLFFAVFKSRHRTKSGLLLSAEEQGDAQSPGDNTRLISPKMAPEEST